MSSDHVLSFFSGAGGFSTGFAKAGLKPISGAELNADACATYEANVGTTCHNVDLSTAEPEFFRRLAGADPFMCIGGPPCQGFSTAGARRSDDPRNRLIFNYLRIVEGVRPRWFLFENVEGLLTSDGGDAVASLVREFLRIGYSVRIEKVNFAGYGVPQTRKRVLIAGNRMGVNFQLPPETHSYASGKSKKQNGKPFAPTLLSAISGLGQPTHEKSRVPYAAPSPLSEYDGLMRGSNTDVSLHTSTTKKEDAARFELLLPGQTMKDLPEAMWHDSYRRRANRRVSDGTPTEKRGGAPAGIKRLHGDLNSLTITGAATREFIHPVEPRTLTLRECARLQSFPDSYEFEGNAASVAQQIGNAVPPIGAQVLAHHFASLDGALASGQRVTAHVSPRLLGIRLTEASGMSPALELTQRKLMSLMQSELLLV
ncbi:MAG: DNA cytosine methyltransferase [Burkholderiales bacterium]|nr:DNA cytosine methyltransferase [Burkholderiales bacterium]